MMWLSLRALKLLCRKSEELVRFSENVTFFHGTLSLGKSTIARLVDFCFGGQLETTIAIQRELLGVQLSLNINNKELLLERNKDENQIRASWVSEEEGPVSVLVRARGDGPVVYGEDVINISDLLFRLAGHPVIRVRKRTDDDTSPMVRLSFRDLFRFCYLAQEDLDSSFFRLGSPVLAEKSKDALNFFTGYYSEKLSTLEVSFDRVRSEQRSKREAAQRIREFLADFGFASDQQIDSEILEIDRRSQEVTTSIRLGNEDYLRQTHFVDERRGYLRSLSDQLLAEQQAVADLDTRIANQRELRAELVSMKFKLARADNARSVLEGSAFENCPNCGQPLAEHRAAPGSCYLCLQVIRPQEAELTSESVNSDLNARIEDIDVALRRHTSARRKQVDYVGEIAGEKARLDREVAELLGTYESDRAARTRGAERELAELQERRRFLNRVRAMPAAVESMLEAADGLNAQLALLERQIRDEQQRLSEADENFRLLEANFLEALLATKVPGVSPTDRIEISRRTLVPTIHPEGRESEGYTFFTAGSGGKKTLFTICFALALHRTAAQKSMPVPSLLIIDTPLKNITPDINPALVTAFYDYLYDVAASDLFDCQIVIIDQLLVAPTPVQAEMIDFSDRLMSLDDPEHPPLISYYNGP